MLDTTQAIDYCRLSDPSSLAGALERICAAFAGAHTLGRVFDSELVARAGPTNVQEAA